MSENLRIVVVDHRVTPSGYRDISLCGDEERVGEWLGASALPVRFTTGLPGIHGVTIATDEGGIALP